MDNQINDSNSTPKDPDDKSSDLNSSRKTQQYDSFDIGYERSVDLDADLFKKFREKALAYRKNVSEILEKNGDKNLFDYVSSYTRENPNKYVKPRREELINVFHDHISKNLGSTIAASVAKQLKTNHSVSTNQKCNPLSNPFTLNATLENSLPYFGGGNNPSLQNIIVLSCANISFNNWNYPKGQLIHTFSGNKITTEQLPFFGHSYDSRPVIFHKSYDESAIIDLKGRLEQLRRENKLEKEKIDQLKYIIDQIYASPHAMSAEYYTDQLTITNYYFFKKLFGYYKKFVPNLIFLSQEIMTLKLIKQNHLHKDTIINRILFDDSLESLIYKHLEGINGTFERSKEYGTYLFWGISDDRKLKLKLWKNGKFLQTNDGKLKIELTPESISKAIDENRLIPSLFLVFALTSFYYGLEVSGGYVQTMYLSQMKERYINLLNEYSAADEVRMIENINTQNFVISFPSIAFLKTKQGYRVPATGFDFFLHGKGGYFWPEVFKSTKTATLNDLINRVLPNYYREFCPDSEKQDIFSKISEADIEKYTDLEAKMPPIAIV